MRHVATCLHAENETRTKLGTEKKSDFSDCIEERHDWNRISWRTKFRTKLLDQKHHEQDKEQKKEKGTPGLEKSDKVDETATKKEQRPHRHHVPTGATLVLHQVQRHRHVTVAIVTTKAAHHVNVVKTDNF